MSNKTFIPAFQARVGDWNYYICLMKYAQVAREVQFAHELGGNKDLNTLIQRGLSTRTDAIVEYLLRNTHRFLGALIIATWGGAPEFVPLSMDDPEGMLKGVDSEFGVLTLDGTHQFFALDGQHRLKAIKDATKKDPALGAEDICVLLVAHFDTPDGRERTQRLFTNINRNAKTTTAAENIALDVDDGFAVTTRNLLTRHPFLSRQGVVKVFSKPPNENGQFTLATNQVPKTDKAALTTITVLYDMLREFSFGLDPAMSDLATRPSDEVLDDSYNILAERLDELFAAADGIETRLTSATNAADIRAPKGQEGLGHPLMRPVAQRAVARALRSIVDDRRLTWPESLDRLRRLDWQLRAAPWTAVFNTDSGKMITAKENVDLLEELLVAHLAPTTKAEISRARKNYRDIRGKTYPPSQDEMEASIIAEPPPAE